MKKILTLAACAALGLATIGCEPKPAAPPPAPTTPESTPPADATPPADPAPAPVEKAP